MPLQIVEFQSPIRFRIIRGALLFHFPSVDWLEKVPSNFLELPVTYQYRETLGKVKGFAKL